MHTLRNGHKGVQSGCVLWRLITFIISANNNIGRIAGIVERLCALCGERAELDGKEYFLFPKPDAIAAREESELLAIGAGYRAPYI